MISDSWQSGTGDVQKRRFVRPSFFMEKEIDVSGNIFQ